MTRDPAAAGGIRIVTEVPGPRSRALAARRDAAGARGARVAGRIANRNGIGCGHLAGPQAVTRSARGSMMKAPGLAPDADS